MKIKTYITFILIVIGFMRPVSGGSVNQYDNVFPFADGEYCDQSIDKFEPIVIIKYPMIEYPLADYGCSIKKYTKKNNTYIVRQKCDVTENNPEAGRSENWRMGKLKKELYVDGVKLAFCKQQASKGGVEKNQPEINGLNQSKPLPKPAVQDVSTLMCNNYIRAISQITSTMRQAGMPISMAEDQVFKMNINDLRLRTFLRELVDSMYKDPDATIEFIKSGRALDFCVTSVRGY